MPADSSSRTAKASDFQAIKLQSMIIVIHLSLIFFSLHEQSNISRSASFNMLPMTLSCNKNLWLCDKRGLLGYIMLRNNVLTTASQDYTILDKCIKVSLFKMLAKVS